MEDKTRTVIICSDGAIRGGYIAGAFFALKKYCPEIWATVTDFTASSASVGGVFYEMAYGDEVLGRKLWTKDFSDPNFIKGGHYNINYLIDTIFKKNNPCDISAIAKSDFGYYFPLIDHGSGKTVIFNNKVEKSGPFASIDYKLFKPELVYEYIRAAVAVPILFDQKIEIEGRKYIDAGFRVPYFVDDELFANHRKIVITAKGELRLFDKLCYRLIGGAYQYFGRFFKAGLDSRYYGEISRKDLLFEQFHEALKLNGTADTFYISPTQKLGSKLDNSQEALLRNYQIGESDLIANIDGLNKFVGIG